MGRVDVGVGSVPGQTPTAGLPWAPFLGGLGQGRCGKPVEGRSVCRLPFGALLE